MVDSVVNVQWSRMGPPRRAHEGKGGGWVLGELFEGGVVGGNDPEGNGMSEEAD